MEVHQTLESWPLQSFSALDYRMLQEQSSLVCINSYHTLFQSNKEPFSRWLLSSRVHEVIPARPWGQRGRVGGHSRRARGHGGRLLRQRAVGAAHHIRISCKGRDDYYVTLHLVCLPEKIGKFILVSFVVGSFLSFFFFVIGWYFLYCIVERGLLQLGSKSCLTRFQFTCSFNTYTSSRMQKCCKISTGAEKIDIVMRCA